MRFYSDVFFPGSSKKPKRCRCKSGQISLPIFFHFLIVTRCALAPDVCRSIIHREFSPISRHSFPCGVRMVDSLPAGKVFSSRKKSARESFCGGKSLSLLWESTLEQSMKVLVKHGHHLSFSFSICLAPNPGNGWMFYLCI